MVEMEHQEHQLDPSLIRTGRLEKKPIDLKNKKK